MASDGYPFSSDDDFHTRKLLPKTQCLRCGSVVRSPSAAVSRHVAACFLAAADSQPTAAAAPQWRPPHPPPAQQPSTSSQPSPTSQLSTAASGPQQEQVLVIRATGPGAYRLHILATRRSTLADIHQLLVDTWLACCEEGHGGVFYRCTEYHYVTYDTPKPLPVERSLFEVFPKRGLPFIHVYDPPVEEGEEDEGEEDERHPVPTITELRVLGLARLSSAGAEWLAGRPAAVATRNEHPGTEWPCRAKGCQRPAVFRQLVLGLMFEHYCSKACRDRRRVEFGEADEWEGEADGWVSEDPDDYTFVDSDGEECDRYPPRRALLHRWWNSPRTACCGYCGGNDAADSAEEAYPELARAAEEQRAGRVPLTAQEEEEEWESEWDGEGKRCLERWGFLEDSWGVPCKRKSGQ